MTTGMEELSQFRWYRIYRDSLDAREVLEHYGAAHVTEQPGENGTTELVHSCLFERVEPHHKNGDAHPSASLNVEKKLYCCRAGGWSGDLLHLVMKLEGKESFSEALLGVSALFHTDADETTVRERLNQILVAEPVAAYSIALPHYSQRILNAFRWRHPHPYLTERGITREAVELLKLGYDVRENRVVFPHFFKGHLVGFQKRTIPGVDKSKVPPEPYPWPGTLPDFPKYRSSSGFPKAETLYGYDLIDTEHVQFPHVVVVESPFSVAKAYSLGIPNVVATFGSAVTEQQRWLLANFVVTVWFDDDEAGRLGERRLVSSLPLATTRVVAPDPGKDLGDYSQRDEVLAKLAAATPAFLVRAGYDTAAVRSAMK